MPSIRESIEAALEEVGEDDQAEGAVVAPTEKVAKPPVEIKETPTEETPAKPPVEKSERPARPTERQPVEIPAQNVKAPISWRPAVREKFGSLPAEVQAEVMRREHEINNGMREASEARKFHREAMDAVSPYLAAIQAEGGTPITAMKSLLGTAYMLRTGQPQQKAQMVADMILQFNIPIETLDQAITARIQGRQMPNDPMMSALQRELAPVRQFMSQIQNGVQQSSQRTEQEITQTVEQFASNPQNEFWEDVKDTVADFLEVAATRGQQMTLQQAYDKAIMLHPEISEVVSQRKLTKTASKRHSAAVKAAKAGASIGTDSSPAPTPPSGRGKSVRSAVEAAYDKHMSDE
jgi:hypothetical protein